MKELTPQALDRAFSRTPACIGESINEAFEQEERRMKLRSRLLSLSGMAAALLMIVTVAALAAGGLEAGRPRPDSVAQPQAIVTSGEDQPDGQSRQDRRNAPVSPTEAPAELYSYTPNGRYIHAVSDCSGMVGAQAHSLAEAYASGKGFCPVCVPSITPEPVPVVTPEPTLIPEEVIENEEVFNEEVSYEIIDDNEIIDDEGFAIIFVGGDGDPCYHSSPSCAGVETALAGLRAQAEDSGLEPCPICLPQETTEPAPTAQDAVGAFEVIFGVPFGEVFPNHKLIENISYAANEQEAGSSLNVFSDGDSEISLDMYAGDEYRLHLNLPDSAAANALMLRTDEPISSLYQEAAPGYIEGIATVVALDENLSYRLQSLQIAYAPDGSLNQCKLIYRLSDDTNVLLCWSLADEPMLTGFIWSND